MIVVVDTDPHLDMYVWPESHTAHTNLADPLAARDMLARFDIGVL